MSCAIGSHNCCQQSDLCTENKTCKPYHSSQKPWKRYTCEPCPDGYFGKGCKQPFRSCQDYSNSSLKSGLYKVVDFDKTVYEVYCHFDSNGSWTLVQSYNAVNGSENTTFRQLRETLTKNLSISENIVIWNGYRLRKSRMKSVQNNSAFLLFTCDYEKCRHIYQSDYLQISLENIKKNGNVADVLELDGQTCNITVDNGHGKIGEYDLSDCQIQLHQEQTSTLHVDIDSTGSLCKFKHASSTCSGRRHYFCSSCTNSCMNQLHRCKQNVNSTTQLWFGNV